MSFFLLSGALPPLPWLLGRFERLRNRRRNAAHLLVSAPSWRRPLRLACLETLKLISKMQIVYEAGLMSGLFTSCNAQSQSTTLSKNQPGGI